MIMVKAELEPMLHYIRRFVVDDKVAAKKALSHEGQGA